MNSTHNYQKNSIIINMAMIICVLAASWLQLQWIDSRWFQDQPNIVYDVLTTMLLAGAVIITVFGGRHKYVADLAIVATVVLLAATVIVFAGPNDTDVYVTNRTEDARLALTGVFLSAAAMMFFAAFWHNQRSYKIVDSTEKTGVFAAHLTTKA